MAYCLWHAIEYQGGMCPRCWQENQQERLIKEHERISAEETRRQADLEEDRARRPTQNRLRNCGWQIVISEWNDTPKRLLGQKTYFWGNKDF
jgi:hypothetical protein